MVANGRPAFRCSDEQVVKLNIILDRYALQFHEARQKMGSGDAGDFVAPSRTGIRAMLKPEQRGRILKRCCSSARSAKKRIADGGGRDRILSAQLRKNDQASLPLPLYLGCEENRPSTNSTNPNTSLEETSADHVPAGAVSRRQRQGEPGGESFQAAISASCIDCVHHQDGEQVSRATITRVQLEGLWRAPKEGLNNWTLMLRTPDFITKAGCAADPARTKAAR